MTALPTPGSIGLVKVDGDVGEAIRLAQFLNGDGFRNYEHAFILYTRGDGLEDSTVTEAEGGGVQQSSLARYAGREVLWLECPQQYSTGMLIAAMKYFGVPYSYTDYFAIAAHTLRSPLERPLQEWVERSHHVICSQMAVACADKAGWDLVGKEWPGYVTPGRLANLALSLGAKPTLIE